MNLRTRIADWIDPDRAHRAAHHTARYQTMREAVEAAPVLLVTSDHREATGIFGARATAHTATIQQILEGKTRGRRYRGMLVTDNALKHSDWREANEILQLSLLHL